MTTLTGPLHPATLIDMAHSPAYFAAAGVVDHAFSWEHAGEAKIADPIIHRLIDRVQVGAPLTDLRFRQGAMVTIRTQDGRAVSNTVHVPKGAAALGIAWSDVDAKYRRLMPTSGLDAGQVEASLRLIHDIRSAASVVPLLRSLEVDRHD